MVEQSAGVLLYRQGEQGLDVLLVHPGGPFWRNKGQGAWQIPKGLIEPDETPEVAARREAEEELGVPLAGSLLSLGTIRQAGGKQVHACALAGDLDPATVRSNLFELEWPPRSRRMHLFPEIDAARWLSCTRRKRRSFQASGRCSSASAILCPEPMAA